jgi:hypothetical protein
MQDAYGGDPVSAAANWSEESLDELRFRVHKLELRSHDRLLEVERCLVELADALWAELREDEYGTDKALRLTGIVLRATNHVREVERFGPFGQARDGLGGIDDMAAAE